MYACRSPGMLAGGFSAQLKWKVCPDTSQTSMVAPSA